MSRVDLSPEQPRISQLRLSFAEEMPERLTSASPPIVRTVQESGGRYEVIEEAEPADANGRNLSAAMVSLLSQITHPHVPDNCEDCQRNPLLNEQRTSYSPRFAVRKAMVELDRMCRRRHRPPQWRDHSSGPVCSLMLRLMVEGGASIAYAAEAVKLDYPRAERLILRGAEYVSDQLARDGKRSRPCTVPNCSVCRSRALEPA